MRPGGLIGVGKDGKLTTYLVVGTATARARALPVRVVITDAEGNVVPTPPDPIVRGVEVALDDADVDEALYFLQRPNPSWSELYKVFERA